MLKFTSVVDILRNASSTCRLFFQASNEDELWYELLDQSSLSEIGPKEAYRQSRTAMLVKLQRGHLVLYRPAQDREETVRLKGPHECSWNSAHTFIDNRHVLTCGSQRDDCFSPKAFLIDITTGKCAQVESMTQSRVGHGLIAVNQRAYAFGGYGPLKSCETWKEGELWRRIGQEMRIARAWLTPCAAKDVIYLCGGGGGLCEQFTPSSESFAHLDIQLPAHGSACSVCYKDCILIVTYCHFALYNRVSRQSCITDRTERKATWSNSPAIIYKDRLIMERDEEENRVIVLTSLLEDPAFALILS